MNDTLNPPEALKFGGGGNNGSLRHQIRLVKAIQKRMNEKPAMYTILTISALRGMTARLRSVYEEALAAVTEVSKNGIRAKLARIFEDHHNALDEQAKITLSDGLFREEDAAPFMERQPKQVALGHAAIGRLREEAQQALERLLLSVEKGDRDSQQSIKAELESFGERLATEGVVLPFLRSLPGSLVAHMPAFTFMRAKVGKDEKFTAPSLLWDESYHRLRGQLTVIADNSVYSGSPIPKGPITVVTEGFIALTPGGAIVTLGTDNSDLTNGVIAAASFFWYFDRLEMAPPAGLKPTSILFKDLDVAHLPPPPMSFDELQRMQELRGSHLVAPDAIKDAKLQEMRIVIVNLDDGREIVMEDPVPVEVHVPK